MMACSASVLYGSYKRWVEDNGGFPLSGTKFGLKLGERGFAKEKSGTVIYHGIGVLDTLDSWDGFSESIQDSTNVNALQGKLSQPSKLSRDAYLVASQGE